ncbi:MAG: hypothetical protein JXA14_10050 [Anaerolineae bacterium]|nr:hypothetical protein [Anaerolineae bacterium]
MENKKKYTKPAVNVVKLELQIGPLGLCDSQGETVEEENCNVSGGCATSP